MFKRILNRIDESKTTDANALNIWKWRFYDHFFPNPPRPFGTVLFVGQQGKGKTSGVANYLSCLPEMFPEKIHVGSVTKTIFSDFQILDKQDIIDAPGNSVLFIDEAGVLFPGEQGKRDLEMLQPLCQSRKKAKQLIFTAQRASLVIKTIRDLTTEVRLCTTQDGRHMIQYIYSDVDLFFSLNDSYRPIEEKIQRADEVLEYVLTNELRRSYDTYEMVSGRFSTGLKLPKWGPSLSEYMAGNVLADVGLPKPDYSVDVPRSELFRLTG